MTQDPMPLAEVLAWAEEVVAEISRDYRAVSEYDEQLCRALSTLCAAVRRMEEDRALLRNAHTVLQRAMAYQGYSLGPLSEPFAQKVLQDLTAALAAEGGDDA